MPYWQYFILPLEQIELSLTLLYLIHFLGCQRWQSEWTPKPVHMVLGNWDPIQKNALEHTSTAPRKQMTRPHSLQSYIVCKHLTTFSVNDRIHTCLKNAHPLCCHAHMCDKWNTREKHEPTVQRFIAGLQFPLALQNFEIIDLFFCPTTSVLCLSQSLSVVIASAGGSFLSS